MRQVEITVTVESDDDDEVAEYANRVWAVAPHGPRSNVVIHDEAITLLAQEKWEESGHETPWKVA